MSTSLPVSRATNAYELLREVIDLIREEPKRLRMDHFLYSEGAIERLSRQGYHAGVPQCGTAGCVAGWIALMAQGLTLSDQITYNADHIAHDTIPDYDADGRMYSALDRIFYTFPTGLRSGTLAYAEEVIEHIEGFRSLYEERLRLIPFTLKHIPSSGESA